MALALSVPVFAHFRNYLQQSISLSTGPSVSKLSVPVAKVVNLKRDNFVKFAVCPKCAALYQLNDCTRLVGGQIVSNVCTRRPFKKGKRGPCGAALAKKVILGSGKVCFYPFKLYCFNSVIEQV